MATKTIIRNFSLHMTLYQRLSNAWPSLITVLKNTQNV